MEIRRKTLWLAVFVGMLLLVIWLAPRFVLLTFGGVLVAALLNALTVLVADHTPLGRRVSLALVVLTLAAGAAGLGWWGVPKVTSQARDVARTVETAVEDVQEWTGESAWGRFLLDQTPTAEELVTGPEALFKRLPGTVGAVWQAVVAVLYLLFLGLFLAIDPRLYRSGLVALLPPERRLRAWEVTGEIGELLQKWLAGAAVQMVFIGFTTALGLWLLGMPHVVALALLAGLLEFIPLVGPILSAIPAILIGFTQSPQQALYVALLFVGVQQIEGNVLVPLVQRHFMALPPALTLTALFVMGALGGLLGVLVAVPLAATVMVLIQRLYIEDTLGDRAGADGSASRAAPEQAG